MNWDTIFEKWELYESLPQSETRKNGLKKAWDTTERYIFETTGLNAAQANNLYGYAAVICRDLYDAHGINPKNGGAKLSDSVRICEELIDNVVINLDNLDGMSPDVDKFDTWKYCEALMEEENTASVLTEMKRDFETALNASHETAEKMYSWSYQFLKKYYPINTSIAELPPTLYLLLEMLSEVKTPTT